MTVAGQAAAPSSVLWQAGGGAQLRPAAAQSHSVSPGTRPEQHCVAIHPLQTPQHHNNNNYNNNKDSADSVQRLEAAV